jgi:predicted dehydrogenase
MTRPVNAAIVGAGLMGRSHANAIEAVGGSVVGVADTRIDVARAIAPEDRAYSAVEDLLAAVTPDVVHICTPVDTHAYVVAAALAARAHVVVEKPLARDGAGTRTLVEGASDAGRLLVPVHQFLFQPGVLRLLDQREELGRLVRATFVAASAGAEGTELTPGELVAEILPHPLSIFARLSTTGVDGLDWTVVVPAQGELRAVAVAGEASFEIAITARGRPTRTELELTGTDATGHADLFHGFAVVERGAVTRAHKIVRPFARSSGVLARATANLAVRAARRETAYPGLRELIRRTYDAIEHGGPPPIAPAETIAVAAARDAILRRGGLAT